MATINVKSGSESPRIDRAIEVSVDDLSKLGPDALKGLKEKFGLDVQLRSSNAGVDEIASELGNNLAKVAEYDRGFDRTNPGYDKYYDRDRAAFMNPGDLVINPATEIGLLVNQLLQHAKG